MNLKLPISVKGIIFNHEHKVLLLRNDRDEWELPGGLIREKRTTSRNSFKRNK